MEKVQPMLLATLRAKLLVKYAIFSSPPSFTGLGILSKSIRRQRRAIAYLRFLS